MLGRLSLSFLLLGLLGVVAPEGASAEGPSCPAVWATSPFPPPPDIAFQSNQVSGTSPSDVWSAGSDYEFGTHVELLHLDGSQWSTVSLPVSGAGDLTGLATIAPDDV